MKKFVFKLEPLYDYRQRMEDICKKELGAATAKFEEEELKLRRLTEQYRASSEEIDALKERGAPMEEISLYYSYLLGVKGYIAGQEKVLAEFRKELDRKRGELMEASKSRKVVEIMKDRSISSHTERENRQEQKTADDMAVSRFKWRVGYEK
ncbi:MAG: flagellar export protein FliJ [Thermodesulfobacteriota bacterium]